MASRRSSAVMLLAVSLIAAAGASWVIITVLRGLQAELIEAQVPEETVPVVVAARNIQSGETLLDSDINIIRIPESYLPSTALRHPDQVVERVPMESILKGEFIRQERLAPHESGFGLNAIVPRGMRAVTIKLGGASVVGGFINPGNYVDIILTIASEGREKRETFPLLQAVRILAVGVRPAHLRFETLRQRGTKSKPLPESDSDGGLITLALTPEDTELVVHARKQGRITLALRNDIDVTLVDMHGAKTNQLLGATETSRTSVKDWRENTKKTKDGTLIVIRGRDKQSTTIPTSK